MFIIFLIFLLFCILIQDWFLSIIAFSFIIYSVSEYISIKKYNNIFGIYENGIIDDNKNFMAWNKIHSYKINENNVSGYYKDGNSFEYKNLENIDEIKNLFEKNRVMKRQ